MEQFKIAEGGFKIIRNQYLRTMIPICIVASIIAISAAEYNYRDELQDVNILPIVIPFFLLIFTLSIVLALKRLKTSFASYKITIGNDEISKNQNNMPEIIIPKSGIKGIYKEKDQGFRIVGQKRNDTIIIPSSIERYIEVEDKLNALSPIVGRSAKTFLEKNQMYLAYVVMALLGVLLISNDPLIIVSTGIVVFSLSIWSLIEQIIQNKNAENRTKIIAPLGMILATILLIFMKLNH